MKLILIGMPGSGKSSLATELSANSGLKYIDTDVFIEKKYNLKINEIFNKLGEEKFREYEHEVLKDILKQDNIVISTGGGMPCFYENIDLMNMSGITVYLDVSLDILMQRIINDSVERPLIKCKSNDEIIEYLKVSLNNRKEYYLKAKYIIDADKSIEEILDQFPFNLNN